VKEKRACGCLKSEIYADRHRRVGLSLADIFGFKYESRTYTDFGQMLPLQKTNTEFAKSEMPLLYISASNNVRTNKLQCGDM
jgi:hypothetical protein